MGHVQPHLIKLPQQKTVPDRFHLFIFKSTKLRDNDLGDRDKYMFILGWWVINEVMKEEDKTCFLTAAG